MPSVITFIKEDFMNAITSPTIIVASLIVGWIVYFVIKHHYKLIIEAKEERIKAKEETIKSRNELLMIAGINELLNIDIQAPKLTTPYAKALSSLIEDEVKQTLIALKNIKNPLSLHSGFNYSLKIGPKYIKGRFENLEIIKEQLKKTQLLKCNMPNNTVELTKLGAEFVDWLIKDGQRALYFHSEVLGSWGSLSEKPKKTNVMIHCAPLQVDTKTI